MLPHHGTIAGKEPRPARRCAEPPPDARPPHRRLLVHRLLVRAGAARRRLRVVAALRAPRAARKASRPSGWRSPVRRGCESCSRVPFGSPGLPRPAARGGAVRHLCHHGAEVGDHRRADFDVDAAWPPTAGNLEAVLDALAAAGGNTVLLTGSVFETDEGARHAARAPSAPMASPRRSPGNASASPPSAAA